MSEYFTAEERAALGGFFALNNEPFDFTPPEFMCLPEDKRPVFTLQDFNVKAQKKREELGLEIDKDNSIYIMLKLCVLGWKNYRTIAGVEIPFVSENGTPTDGCIESIGLSTKLAILKRINGE